MGKQVKQMQSAATCQLLVQCQPLSGGRVTSWRRKKACLLAPCPDDSMLSTKVPFSSSRHCKDHATLIWRV